MGLNDNTFLPKAPFPNWSDDDDYPAGSDPWSASPTKIEPAFGVRTAGVTPNDQMVAQWYNWLNNKYGAMLDVLVHTPMQTWTPIAIANGDGLGCFDIDDGVTPGDQPMLLGGVLTTMNTALGSGLSAPFNTSFPQRGGFFVSGDDGSGSAWHYAFSSSGFQWTRQSIAIDGAPTDACGEAEGSLVIVSTADRKIYYTLDAFSTSLVATANVAPAAAGFLSVTKMATNNRLLATVWDAAPGNQFRVAISTDLGATWTTEDIGTDAYTFLQVAHNGKAIGDGNVCVATAGFNAAIFVSNDDGTTWSFVRLTTGSASSAGVTYSPVWDQFMVIDSDGNILTSADGLSWVLRTSPFTGDDGLALARSKPIACVGSVFAIAMNVASPGGAIGGIFYSFDIGSSWNWVPLTKAGDSTRAVQGIKSLGCRFGVMSQGAVYLSAPLWSPRFDVLVG